jgi:hypothetical protein
MQVEIFPRSVLVEREGLAARAQEVLGQNDMGGWTRAASDLYLCQPPTHAIAAQRIWEAATNGRARAEATAFLRDIYPKLLSWHRYLLV